MISVSRFELDHLSQAKKYDDLVRAFSGNPTAVNMYSSGPAYTIFDGDQVVAMMGLIIQWKGVASAWCLPTDLVNKYPIYFCKIAKWIIKTGIDVYGLRKIIAYVEPSNEVAERWIKFLGFNHEATLKKHNWNGEDLHLFSIITE